MSNHENLKVWQNAVNWACDIIKLSENLNCDKIHYRLLEQIEASSCSVAMNIAEGSGRYSIKEFIHFLYIARGSLYETTTLLNIFCKMGWIDESEMDKHILKNS